MIPLIEKTRKQISDSRADIEEGLESIEKKKEEGKQLEQETINIEGRKEKLKGEIDSA